jgi:hypothetical protein
MMALRLFCILVFDIERRAPPACKLDVAQTQTWVTLPVLPMSRDVQTQRQNSKHRHHQTAFGNAMKDALRTGAGKKDHHLSGLNVATAVRSAGCIELYDAGCSGEQVRTPSCAPRSACCHALCWCMLMNRA